MTHVDIAWDNANRVWLATARGPDNAPGFVLQDASMAMLKQRVRERMGEDAWRCRSLRIVTPILLGRR